MGVMYCDCNSYTITAVISTLAHRYVLPMGVILCMTVITILFQILPCHGNTFYNYIIRCVYIVHMPVACVALTVLWYLAMNVHNIVVSSDGILIIV